MTDENTTPERPPVQSVQWSNLSTTRDLRDPVNSIELMPPVEIVTDVAIAIGELADISRRTNTETPVCLLRVLGQYLLIASEQLAVESSPSYTLCAVKQESEGTNNA